MMWRRKTAFCLVCATMLGMLSACAENRSVSSFCSLSEPIFASEQDTEETIEQVVRHNALIFALCPEHQYPEDS
jgi:hypothetical protein